MTQNSEFLLLTLFYNYCLVGIGQRNLLHQEVWYGILTIEGDYLSATLATGFQKFWAYRIGNIHSVFLTISVSQLRESTLLHA